MWQPRDKYCWDFWFTRHQDQLHVFFLQASRHDCLYQPERRHGLASIGHAVLTDYGWREINPQQPAFSKRTGEHWDNFSIWTGSIIEQEGCFYLFYTSRCLADPLLYTPQERQRSQQIGIATSHDLHHWTRTSTTTAQPVIPNPGRGEFDGVSWRDPYVIEEKMHSPTAPRYYAFICARLNDAPVDAGGCIAYVESSHLEQWLDPPKLLYHSLEFYQTEVPQVFWRETGAGWRFYLLFCAREEDASQMRRSPTTGTYYVRSQPIADRTTVHYDAIPWEPEPANLLSDGFYAGKLIDPETDPYPIFFGFQHEDEAGCFVGGISDPYWAIFDDSGMIHLKDEKPQS